MFLLSKSPRSITILLSVYFYFRVGLPGSPLKISKGPVTKIQLPENKFAASRSCLVESLRDKPSYNSESFITFRILILTQQFFEQSLL